MEFFEVRTPGEEVTGWWLAAGTAMSAG